LAHLGAYLRRPVEGLTQTVGHRRAQIWLHP
jgi:hypothetical protein